MQEEYSETGQSAISSAGGLHHGTILHNVAKGVNSRIDYEGIKKQKSIDYLFDETIARIWKYGIRVKMGNSFRELSPEEICPKLKKLKQIMENKEKLLSKADYAVLINGLRLISCGSLRKSFLANKIKYNKFVVHWHFIKTLNRVVKEHA